MIYRKLYMYSSWETSLKLYKSLFRPHMEYASAVWDSYLRKDIKLIEDVQKFALKVCTENWGTSYNVLLSSCNLNTMADRRNKSRLCILFKIVTGDISYVQTQKSSLPVEVREHLTVYCQLCQDQRLWKLVFS